VSVQPSGNKGVTLKTKKEGKANTPAKSVNTHKFKSTSSNQKYVDPLSARLGCED